MIQSDFKKMAFMPDANIESLIDDDKLVFYIPFNII